MIENFRNDMFIMFEFMNVILFLEKKIWEWFELFFLGYLFLYLVVLNFFFLYLVSLVILMV